MATKQCETCAMACGEAKEKVKVLEKKMFRTMMALVICATLLGKEAIKETMDILWGVEALVDPSTILPEENAGNEPPVRTSLSQPLGPPEGQEYGEPKGGAVPSGSLPLFRGRDLVPDSPRFLITQPIGVRNERSILPPEGRETELPMEPFEEFMVPPLVVRTYSEEFMVCDSEKTYLVPQPGAFLLMGVSMIFGGAWRGRR